MAYKRKYRRGSSKSHAGECPKCGYSPHGFESRQSCDMEVGMDNIKFGRFIRESRQAKGMTQKQLAEKIHVSDKAVSKWENGVSHN